LIAWKCGLSDAIRTPDPFGGQSHSNLADTAMASSLVAVDVGNSRMKWGRFAAGALEEAVSLPLDDPPALLAQARAWHLASGNIAAGDTQGPKSDQAFSWAVASVNPAASQPLLDWIERSVTSSACVLDDPAKLPLCVDLEQPATVGMDRLLNAVAV